MDKAIRSDLFVTFMFYVILSIYGIPKRIFRLYSSLDEHTARFFMMLYWSSTKSKIQTLLPVVLQLTGIGIAFSMILFYYEILTFKDSIVAERFAGVFQYPNTFAMVMAVFFLISLVMMTKEKLPRWIFILYSLPDSCL